MGTARGGAGRRDLLCRGGKQKKNRIFNSFFYFALYLKMGLLLGGVQYYFLCPRKKCKRSQSHPTLITINNCLHTRRRLCAQLLRPGPGFWHLLAKPGRFADPTAGSEPRLTSPQAAFLGRQQPLPASALHSSPCASHPPHSSLEGGFTRQWWGLCAHKQGAEKRGR